MGGRTKGKRRVRSFITILAAPALMMSFATSSGAYERPGTNEMVSLSSQGHQGHLPPERNLDGFCPTKIGPPSINRSGRYVAFASLLEGLASGSEPLWTEIFMKDRITGELEIVSNPSTGAPVVPSSKFLEEASRLHEVCTNAVVASHPSVSASGRYVAFISAATNLVPGDTNDTYDVFVRDRKNGAIRRVSVASDGSEGTGPSGNAGEARVWTELSADGRYISFFSDADNLVADDTNNSIDVFVHDLKNGRTTRASVADDGSQAPSGVGSVASGVNAGPDERLAMSHSGRFVAFTSQDDLDPEGPAPKPHSTISNQKPSDFSTVYVRDLQKGQTDVAAITIDGYRQGFDSPVVNSVSNDGLLVVYSTREKDSVPNDDPNNDNPVPTKDFFVLDRDTGRTERVTVTSAGEAPDDHSDAWMSGPGLSSNGRYVIFTSLEEEFSEIEDQPCPELPGAFTNDPCVTDYDVFRHDRQTGSVSRVSVGFDGDDLACPENVSRSGNSFTRGCTGILSVTWDGRRVAFMSQAANLVRGDTNSAFDVFVRDLGGPVGAGKKRQQNISPPHRREERNCVGEGCRPLCIMEMCIPFQGPVFTSDSTDDIEDAPTEQGANLYGASLAYRPQYKDLFAAIELEHMPKVIPGASPIFYGLRFKVEGKRYEVRATSLAGGTFGLFDCTGTRPACTKIADLKGGYGTTGERVVFSLPLEEIGLEDGGELKDVTAFSGIGSDLTGATKILDTVKVK